MGVRHGWKEEYGCFVAKLVNCDSHLSVYCWIPLSFFLRSAAYDRDLCLPDSLASDSWTALDSGKQADRIGEGEKSVCFSLVSVFVSFG